MAAIATAILVAARSGAQSRLRTLCDLLTDLGVTVAVVESAEDAAAQMLIGAPDEPLLVLIEASAVPDDPEGREILLETIHDTVAGLSGTLPNAATVIAAARPSARLIIESFRSGAADFIDLSSDNREALQALLERQGETLERKLEQHRRARNLRGMIDEFLRDLIKTERRSIDLEHELQSKDKRKHERFGDLDTEREPVVVIIEDDKEVSALLVEELEDKGIATYAFVNGEDAIEGVRKMVVKGEAIDLALVDQVLPGITGLEAIAGMRRHRARLAAFLMTGHSDNKLARRAADLGVVGYVLKPFDDIAGLVDRIKEQAELYRDQARDRHYLEQIKQRHEKVLNQYRQMASDLDKLS